MDVLRQWLADVGIQVHNSSSLEQDFASGYLFAELLAAHTQQPDLAAFQNKGKPDAYLNNYMRLQPTLSRLGVQLDTRTAQALINKEPGLAAKVLLSIKQQLDGLTTNLQAAGNPASKTLQQCTVRTSPSPGLLEAQHHKSQYAALDASNSKFFEDVMRKNSSSPNRLMESIHLKRFADEGSRQAAAAAEAAAAAAAAHAAGRSAFRGELKDKMATGRHEKATQLQRDEAVHAAILRHQDDVERQELRVEMALAELSSHRQQDQRRAAAVDAAAGIDAFEMTLKRLGASAGSNTEEAPSPAMGESPMATLGRIRSFAPMAAKLADSKDEYLSVIKARRQEEAAARKEREGRRRRMLVEQQAARSAAEGRVEADCLLEVLVRRSAEEQKLAHHLWQLQQEKAAMEAGRRLREEQYATLKDKEWEDTLRREAELHRSLQSQHAATVQQELAAWHEHQDVSVLAAEAEKAGLAHDTARQLVQLAERVVQFRAATGGQPVPLADWRAWLSLFLAGDPALGTPVVSSDPEALHEPPSAQRVINTSELRDFLAGEGAWALPPAAAPAAAPTGPTAAGVQAVPALPPPQSHKALGEVVADLAKLSQKLKPQLAAAQQAQKQRPQEQQCTQQPGAELLEGDGTQAAADDTSSDAVPADGDAAAGIAAGPGPALVSAAEAASGSGAAPGADVIHTLPLRLAVVGTPFSGKSVVAHTLAQAFGLKLLAPQQLVAEATAAAAAWQQQQQSKIAEAAPHTETKAPVESERSQPGPDPPVLVVLGLQADVQLQAGQPVADDVLVQLLLLGMQQAKTYVAAPPEPAQPEPPAAKCSKVSAPKAAGNAKSDAGAAGARHGTSSGVAAAPGSHAHPALGVAGAMAAGLGSAAPGPALPANLAAGVPGRGFVVDGFPATEAQAVLLEKALTGLDLSAEQELLQGTSLIVPPPASKLPQLQRPLLSGLDAVILLDCDDETLALQRVLGRRLDPVTGQLYHLDFDPRPVTNPGLVERLVQPPGQEEQAAKVPDRLAGWAASSPALTAWLARFTSLPRPLNGSAPLAEVLIAAGDVVSGILTAKGAAQAALAAADAARQAQASAGKAQELSRASQLHAEAAARDLLAAKKAEMQVLPLMTGGKNPDPAAAELLKAQAAAKCAEQLKVCHAAARDAAAHAEHAHAAAEAAAAAVMSAKTAVGDASVSAEAQVQANKAAVDAQAAATAAAEAASKAQAAKQLSDSYAQDAEKLATAADVPADASVGPATQVPAVSPAAVAATSAASSRPASGRNSISKAAGSRAAQGTPATPASTAASNLSSSSTSASGSSSTGADSTLRPAGSLPALLAASLHEEWSVLEHTYVEGMGRGFAGLREAHSLAVNQVAANRSCFSALLQQPDNRQALLQDFVTRFNSVELDMRKTDEAKGELLLRCEELRDALWALCDAKHDAVEAARLKLAADGSAADQVALMGSQLNSLVQVELDRFMATAQFLWSYCHSSHGVYHPSVPADKAFTHLNVLAAPELGSAAKPNAAGAAAAAAAGTPAQMAALQQRLPQLAAALKAALTAAAAAEASALSVVSDAQQKAAAAAAHASATASAAASAAAAAAGLSTTGAAPHRQPTNAGGKGASSAGSGGSAGAAGKSSAAAAAANSKLAASSEEAAAVAAAAAAALAEMPDQAALAAVHAELQAALGVEVALLQQRLSVLGHRAGVLVEEVVQLHGTANSQMAEQLHRRYVEECGAVAALERVTKAAAAAGKPLAKDLRLEDEFLVMDSSQQLVPPPAEQPPARPASPPLPPGMLSVEQLRATSAALQSAEHPAGFLAVQSAVELMMGLASQGALPPAWREIDASHMAGALSAFDPTYSGYLDWRALLLALAAASLPAIHTATAAQVAVQALQLSAADADADGQLTQQEFEGLTWWFEPRQELQEAAAAAPDQHPDVLRETSRCRQFSQLLWDVFKTPLAAQAKDTPALTAPLSQQPEAADSEPAPTAAVRPVGAATGGSRRGTASGSSRPLTADAAAADAVADAAAAAATAAAPPGEAAVFVVPAKAVLLYLCLDRDLYAGIVKAMSAVTQTTLPGAMVDAQGLLSMCYPLIQPEQAAQVCRAPLTAQQIAAAVAATAAAGAAPVPPSAPMATASAAGGGKGGGGSGAGSRKPSCPGASPAAVADASAAAGETAVQLKASQLMYGAACERVVTLLLHRYQWVDVYVNALL